MRESVVVAREDQPGVQRLVAYVVPNPNSKGLLSQMDAQAAEHLANWQALFEDIYGQTSVPPGASIQYHGLEQ